MEPNSDIDKQIELKRLEIEKLKLEKEAVGDGNIRSQQVSVTYADAGKYPNYIAYNVVILLIAILCFYVLPWGRFSSTVSTNFGGGSFFSNPYTGFNLGLFTYSYPITFINIGLLILIFLNNLKYLGFVAIAGVLASIVAVVNTSQAESLHASFSNQFGSVSAGVEATGWSYLLPIAYTILTLINITKKKVLYFDNQKHEVGTINNSTHFVNEDWEVDYKLSKINLNLAIITGLIGALSIVPLLPLILFWYLHIKQRNTFSYAVYSYQTNNYKTVIMLGVILNIILFAVCLYAIIDRTILVTRAGEYTSSFGWLFYLMYFLLNISLVIYSLNIVASFKRYKTLNFITQVP